MGSIFDGAPRARATIVGKATTDDDLTGNVSNTVFVEFLDGEGRPSRGSQDYPISKRCSLEEGDEVEIAYVPHGEEFELLTEPFVRFTTGVLKGMLRVAGQRRAAEIVDETLAEDERFESYRIDIIGFDRYIA